ncbi:MAG: hypothetical protein AAF270_12835 [Pseudomonadota bacterium]
MRHSVFAREGFWLIGICVIGAVLLAKFAGPAWALPMLVPIVLLLLLFQDPRRDVPLKPLAALSPVDGTVLEVGLCRSGLLDRESLRIIIRVNPWGAYTVRAPVEGTVFDPRDNAREGSRLTGRSGLWLRSDEGDDVVVAFSGRGWLGRPKSLRRYGERIGHGHRVALLRLAPRCELYLPANALPRVDAGDPVRAAMTELAELRRDNPVRDASEAGD